MATSEPNMVVCDQDEYGTSLDMFFLFICSTIVFLMQAGFAFLEAGTVSEKVVTHVLFKNVFDIVLGSFAFFSVGYAFSYGSTTNKLVGDTGFFLIDVNPCAYAFFFFQYAFAATSTTIISGALAGRASVYTYSLYSIFMTGFVYPAVVHWVWAEDGWLAAGNGDVGFRDFAGSGVVHVTGGMAAVVGAAMLGPRRDRLRNGKLVHIPPHSTPFATLGGMLLMTGFFAFNAGSILRIDDSTGQYGMAVAYAVINTCLALVGGGLSSSLLEKFINGELSLMYTINGMLAGAVAICAGADVYEPWSAWVIGFIGGIAFYGWSKVLPYIGVDDAIDAVGVHLGAGLWGVVARSLFDTYDGLFYANASDGFLFLGWQLAGAVVICTWSAFLSMCVFWPLKKLGKLRVSEEAEILGLDNAEHNEAAYTDHQKTSAFDAFHMTTQSEV